MKIVGRFFVEIFLWAILWAKSDALSHGALVSPMPAITAYVAAHIAPASREDYLDPMCKFTIAFDREDDVRFIAVVQAIPFVS
jgi:hypothetical protein